MADGQKRGRGRPPILEPDDKTLSQLRNLRLIQCTTEEAAAVFGVHRSTLHEFLARHDEAREAWEAGKHEGLVSLRRKQFKLAETNPTMAIFLGKQYLGQKDRRELDIDVSRLSDKQLEQLEAILSEGSGD